MARDVDRRFGAHVALLAALVDRVSVPPREILALRQAQVVLHHLGDELAETDGRLPAQLPARLGRVAEEAVDLRRPQIAWIHAYYRLPRLGRRPAPGLAPEHADLFRAVAFPVDLQVDLGRGRLDQIAHAVALACGDDVVLGPRLLEHQPLGFDVVPRMSPIASRVQVADVKTVLHAQGDARKRARDL